MISTVLSFLPLIYKDAEDRASEGPGVTGGSQSGGEPQVGISELSSKEAHWPVSREPS